MIHQKDSNLYAASEFSGVCVFLYIAQLIVVLCNGWVLFDSFGMASLKKVLF